MNQNREDIKAAISGGLKPSETRSRGSAVTDHRIMCIYHGNCLDGFGAAWAMRHWMPKAEIEFIPAKYTDKVIPKVKNRVVYILDFSYPREVMIQMLEDAATLLLLDHHETAMKNLIGLDCSPDGHASKQYRDGMQFWISDGGRLFLDMKKSGAGLAWDYFSQGKPRNPLISHIEDRDLWNFRLEGTREINAAMFSYPYDMQEWDALMMRTPEDLLIEGTGIERKHFKDVNELVRENMRWMTIKGHRVPVANVPYTLSSDACRVLMELNRWSWGACYSDTPKGRVFSLRSEKGGFNVAALAESYGGGGHQAAAGFTAPIGWEGDEAIVPPTDVTQTAIMLGWMSAEYPHLEQQLKDIARRLDQVPTENEVASTPRGIL